MVVGDWAWKTDGAYMSAFIELINDGTCSFYPLGEKAEFNRTDLELDFCYWNFEYDQQFKLYVPDDKAIDIPFIVEGVSFMSREKPSLKEMVVGKWLWNADDDSLYPHALIELEKKGTCSFWSFADEAN